MKNGFHSFQGTPKERLQQLVSCIKAKGWKGVGGWICAQKADNQHEIDENSYWTERIRTADESDSITGRLTGGITYTMGNGGKC